MATSRRRAATTSAAQATNGRVRVLQKVKRPGASVAQPHSAEHLAWYVGLTLMALFEVIRVASCACHLPWATSSPIERRTGLSANSLKESKPAAERHVAA